MEAELVLVPNKMVPVQIKLVRNALSVPRIKVAEPAGGGGGVDSSWFQVQLINPSDSGDVLDSATAEHRARNTYEISFWYHQFALILGGEMFTQDLTTGEVFLGHEGDVFHWAPGHIMRIGGEFIALGIRTPVPQRWVNSPKGKKEVVMHTPPNEILQPGAAPDEVRPANGRKPSSRMKLVRGATSLKMPSEKGSGDCQRVMFVNPVETDLIGSASIEERRGGRTAESNHRWHQVGYMVSGELVTQNLDTGEVYRMRKGDLFYWGPDLRHSIEGEYRMYTVRTPEPLRLLGGSGGEVDLLRNAREETYPASKPDSVATHVITEV